MTSRVSHLYPFLFAMVPVLHLAAINPGESTLGDLLVVLLAVLVGCALVYAVAALVLRGRGSALPALVTFIGVLFFFGLRERAHVLLAPVFLVAGVPVVRGLVRRPPLLERLSSLLTLTGGLLVVWSAGGDVSNRLRANESVKASALVRRLARPIATVTSAGAVQPRRDIYLIVLDEYANSGVLRQEYGYDNRRFEDSLRRLGFVLPPVVQSNYVHSMLSVPSLLNASHLTAATAEVGAAAKDPTLAYYLLNHSRVVRFLQARGYRFVFFPSGWWFATRDHPLANLEYRASTGVRLGRELTRSELRRVLLRNTLLDYLYRSHAPDAEHVRSTLAGVARVPELRGPVLVVAHLINPHSPFVFERDCRTAPWRSGRGERGGVYVAQVECLNGMLLRLVTTLLRESAVPPIILLQGDHGTKRLKFSYYPTADSIPAAAARERLGAFGAYYLPSHGAEAFGDTVTVVNVLGNVLRYYFNADLPREPDDRYLSLGRSPYAFHKVDPRWLAREAPGPGESRASD
ncbi:MAG: hypothetical protein ACREMX_04730 [Gemmatimonadales bacterium]